MNTKARKYDIKIARPTKYQVKQNTQQHNKSIYYVVYIYAD